MNEARALITRGIKSFFSLVVYILFFARGMKSKIGIKSKFGGTKSNFLSLYFIERDEKLLFIPRDKKCHFSTANCGQWYPQELKFLFLIIVFISMHWNDKKVNCNFKIYIYIWMVKIQIMCITLIWYKGICCLFLVYVSDDTY